MNKLVKESSKADMRELIRDIDKMVSHIQEASKISEDAALLAADLAIEGWDVGAIADQLASMGEKFEGMLHSQETGMEADEWGLVNVLNELSNAQEAGIGGSLPLREEE